MTEILNSQTESLFKLHSYSKKQTILLYAVPILLLIFISIAYLTSGSWLAGNDSVIYMEMAQYCYQGDGFSMCYSSGLQPDLVYPVGAWPPGYSLLMIPFIAAGLSPYYAGLTVSILSSIGFFFIILYFFSKIFPFEFALTAGIGTLLWQTGCLVFVGSEPSFLFFSSLSIYFLERGIDKKSRFQLFLSGILCGWSVTIRYAALALVAAELIWLFLQPNWKKKYSTLFLWLIGVVLGGGWLVCRNIHTFGTAFPHCQGEPTQSFIVRFVKETITFLTGSYPIHKNFLVLSLLGVIFIAFFAALTFGILRNGKKNRISFGRFPKLSFLFRYFFDGTKIIQFTQF